MILFTTLMQLALEYNIYCTILKYIDKYQLGLPCIYTVQRQCLEVIHIKLYHPCVHMNSVRHSKCISNFACSVKFIEDKYIYK